MSFITSPGVIIPPLTAGGVAYGTGSQAKVNNAGVTGQALLSAGAGVPTFGVPTGAVSPPYTAGAIAYGTGTGITLNAAGTAGQVLTSNGAGVPTFANTVTSFSGASTGLTPATATTGAVSLAGTLAVGSGGTSLSTLTANNVILGNGASAPTFVAPGTSGNLLTSNGTTWQSTAAAPAGGLTLGTPVPSTSGTSIDFTGIPAGTKSITITLKGVLNAGPSSLLFQIGDAGGIETTGYVGTGTRIAALNTRTNFTAGFGVGTEGGANTVSGTVVLTLENSTNFSWVAAGVLGNSGNAESHLTGGSKTLSQQLDRVRITSVNGAESFTAGEINIAYM